MDCAVLVPRRRADEHREAAWRHVRGIYRAGGFPIVTGASPAGPFNRSAAINRAARRALAQGAEVLVVADGDTVVDPAQVRSAVLMAGATGTVTFAFHRYAALDRPGTAKVLAGYDGSWEPHVAYEYENTASSCLAVRADLWAELGGFDESFVGWGWEDVAFSLAAQTLGGGMHRIAGTAWHLWHPQAEGAGDTGSPIWQANEARARPYQNACGDRAAMLEVLAR